MADLSRYAIVAKPIVGRRSHNAVEMLRWKFLQDLQSVAVIYVPICVSETLTGAVVFVSHSSVIVTQSQLARDLGAYSNWFSNNKKAEPEGPAQATRRSSMPLHSR